MKNYQKLDKIVEDLDKESKSLKSLSSVIDRLNQLNKTTVENFEKIMELKKEFNFISKVQVENADKLEKTLVKIDTSVNESIIKIERRQRELKEILDKELDEIKKTIIQEIVELNTEIKKLSGILVQTIQAGYKEISEDQKNALNKINTKIDEIYKDNKLFQKELDSSIASRLDKHKSDIQVVIRDEGNQIQRAIETTLNSGFNQMESKMKHAFEQQTKQLNKLKTLTFILIAVSVGLAVGLFFLGS